MGDAALLVELGQALDPFVNARVHALSRQLQSHAGITGLVPGYATLLVEYQAGEVDAEELGSEIAALASAPFDEEGQPRVIEIPTRYGGELGPDLDFVAAHNGLVPAEVIRIHTQELYQVFMIGFAPGFPYLGLVPERIAAPRLETPRARVPAGSVGIAGRQTGIYPRESPGGWRLIGRTAVPLFDAAREPPALLQPGDRVRFVRVE
jgi:KipI family sensor histidine kinase inhibitor